MKVSLQRRGKDSGQGKHLQIGETGPLLRAGLTEVKPLAAEWREAFILAVRVGALDAGYSLEVVAPENELFLHLADAFDAEGRPKMITCLASYCWEEL